MSYKTRYLVARNIRSLRSPLNWSQERLAEVSGLHRTYIGAVERCERNISLDNLTKIAMALNVSLARLFETSTQTGNTSNRIREDFAAYRYTISLLQSNNLQQISPQ